MRLACDTGGTFTDLLVERNDGKVAMFKSPTTPHDPVEGVIAAISLAARADGLELDRFLGGVDAIIHGTTHAINAIITGRVARTALLTTQGHPDVLVLREGGRGDPFEHDQAYPPPYIPKSLTFEIPERIDYAGTILRPLDEEHVVGVMRALREEGVEAVACCLLWSIANPSHELRIGELIEQHLPGVPYTLSHALNPSLREYRRAISTAIDASLKPTMTRYLGLLEGRLRDAGFRGHLLVQTSEGGMLGAGQLARTPIQTLNSGPSLAPVAGARIARSLGVMADVIVADTGGTTYDVTLIRDGRIPMTRESWVGRPHEGLMTGFPSVDVKSVGAGGGSIAWLDAGGLLRVGPASAGARPGPACFGLGGVRPTVTDAAVVLGYVDPDYFLGGQMKLRADLAREALNTIAEPLGITTERAALAVYGIATENMVQAILDITVRQGIDPARALLVGGGGAAGLNSTMIGRRLGCEQVVIPEVGACLSAAGALLSDIKCSFRRTRFSSTAAFDFDAINGCLSELADQASSFVIDAGGTVADCRFDFYCEARYPNQVWEIDVPFELRAFRTDADLKHLRERFHAAHRAMFGYDEPAADVEIVTWCVVASMRSPHRASEDLTLRGQESSRSQRLRKMWFDGHASAIETPVYDLIALPEGETLRGPAIVETPVTTVVVDPAASLRFDRRAGLVITP
jgi:N-methylhydantoinase A